MRFIPGAAIAAALLLNNGVASATNFVEVGSTDDGRVSIDVDSVKIRYGSLTAWSKESYNKKQPNGARSTIVLDRIDCDSEAFTTMSTTDYSAEDGRGAVLSSENYSDLPIRMKPAIPGSKAAAIVAIACYIQQNGSIKGFSQAIDSDLEMRAIADSSAAAAEAAAAADPR